MDFASALFPSHESAAPEAGQVPRDVRLAKSSRCNQIGDARISSTKLLEDAQARGIRQAMKELGLKGDRMPRSEHSKSITGYVYVSQRLREGEPFREIRLSGL